MSKDDDVYSQLFDLQLGEYGVSVPGRKDCSSEVSDFLSLVLVNSVNISLRQPDVAPRRWRCLTNG